MKKKPILLILFCLATLIFTSCEKEKDDINGTVELYLLESFSTNDNYAIDESSIKIKSTPLITYSEFLSYDSSNYELEISESAREKIENIEHSVHGVAFAVKADDEMIYTGYFWPSYSSASCNWIVIDPMGVGLRNKLYIELGYAFTCDETITDRRNDNRILNIFKSDGKLR